MNMRKTEFCFNPVLCFSVLCKCCISLTRLECGYMLLHVVLPDMFKWLQRCVPSNDWPHLIQDIQISPLFLACCIFFLPHIGQLSSILDSLGFSLQLCDLFSSCAAPFCQTVLREQQFFNLRCLALRLETVEHVKSWLYPCTLRMSKWNITLLHSEPLTLCYIHCWLNDI